MFSWREFREKLNARVVTATRISLEIQGQVTEVNINYTMILGPHFHDNPVTSVHFWLFLCLHIIRAKTFVSKQQRSGGVNSCNLDAKSAIISSQTPFFVDLAANVVGKPAAVLAFREQSSWWVNHGPPLLTATHSNMESPIFNINLKLVNLLNLSSTNQPNICSHNDSIHP